MGASQGLGRSWSRLALPLVSVLLAGWVLTATPAALGDNGGSLAIATPGAIAPQISAAFDGRHTCAITSSGHRTCWGSNSDGQTAEPNGSAIPTWQSTYLAVGARDRDTCAVRNNGHIICRGNNSGTPDRVKHMVPWLSRSGSTPTAACTSTPPQSAG